MRIFSILYSIVYEGLLIVIKCDFIQDNFTVHYNKLEVDARKHTDVQTKVQFTQC